VTQSTSERAVPYDELSELVREHAAGDIVTQFETLAQAVADARAWAAQSERRAVLITGSITLVGEAIALATAEGWK